MFNFPLEKVLEMRRELEKEKARVLAEARATERGAQEARDALVRQRDNGRESLSDVHRGGGAVGHLQNLEYVLDCVDHQVRQADEACRTAEQGVTESLTEFRAAFVDRKSLDQLRDRRKAAWKTIADRTEQKAMDEVAGTRHVRAGSASSSKEPSR